MVFLVVPALADWPDHHVKYDQSSPVDDWAAISVINAPDPGPTAQTADDFPCTGLPQDRYVTDLRFWGFSYYGNTWISQFRITFWDDVPATPNDESHPGNLLYDYYVNPANPNDPLKIGWQDLADGSFKIDLPQDHWFDQGLAPRTLWLGIQGVMVVDGYADYFYWNFRDPTSTHFGDDAAFWSSDYGYAPWANWGFPGDPADGPDLYDGPFPAGWFSSADMAFTLTCVPEPTTLLLLGIGAALLRRR
jgi:hypothetical protein